MNIPMQLDPRTQEHLRQSWGIVEAYRRGMITEYEMESSAPLNGRGVSPLPDSDTGPAAPLTEKDKS